MLFHSNLSNKLEKADGHFGGGAKKCGGQNHQFLKVRGTCVRGGGGGGPANHKAGHHLS